MSTKRGAGAGEPVSVSLEVHGAKRGRIRSNLLECSRTGWVAVPRDAVISNLAFEVSEAEPGTAKVRFGFSRFPWSTKARGEGGAPALSKHASAEDRRGVYVPSTTRQPVRRQVNIGSFALFTRQPIAIIGRNECRD